MDSAIDRRPNFRISDVEELMRETGMDNSDTGIGIVNYFRRRQADFHRGRLFDGSDNQINFRLDNLQPVQLPPPTKEADNSANVAKEAQTGVLLVRPLSELTVADNRGPSFVSPGRIAPNFSSRNPPRLLTNTVSSPPSRSSVRVSPIVSIPNSTSSVQNSRQRELILQKQKRENQMKMELLRNTASQVVSSTPIAGNRFECRGENVLDLRETISPIHDDAEQGTPTRVPRTVSEEHRDRQVPSRPSVTQTRAIRTPIPATQDAPDGLDRNGRETTPPPSLNENCIVVVPETPSPVRKSPRIPNTPLSGLSLTKRTTHLALPGALAHLRKGSSIRVGSPAASTPSRSILKNRKSRLASSRHRVSFSEQLFAVRECTPSPNNSDMTSDEDEAQERDNGPVGPIEEPVGNEQENAQHSRRLFGARRSNAVEELDENAWNGNDSPRRHNNRTNGNTVNMIMDDWNEPVSEQMEVDEPEENREPPVAQSTINKSIAITNIDTPRTVMMDIFDPPSAFCDDGEEEVMEENDLNMEVPVSEEPALKRPEQSRKRKATDDVGDGDGDDDSDSHRSAFCDDGEEEEMEENDLNVEVPVSEESALKRPEQSRKRKATDDVGDGDGDDDSDRDNSSRQNSIDKNNARTLRVSPRKMSNPSFNVTLNNIQHTERIVNVDSPNDHVPLNMIQAVDMIHSRVNSELMDTGGARDIGDERRITLNIPSKRRTIKAKLDDDAEMYLKMIENACAKKKPKDKQRKDRRKLFVHEMLEAQKENDAYDEPQPFPPTQEAVNTVKQDKQQRYVLRSLVVPVTRLSINTIRKATHPDVPDEEETDFNTRTKESAIESPIQEKQNEEQSEKGDRPKSPDRVEQRDDVVDTEQERPRKGKSNRDQRNDIVDTEQDRPRKGKSNREQRDDIMDTEQDRPSKGKSNREQRDDVMDTEQDRPRKGKPYREQRDDVMDTEQDRPRKGKSNREQRDDVVDTEQDRPRKGKSNREQRDDVLDTEPDRPRKGKSNREHRDDAVESEQDHPHKGKSNREQREDVVDTEQDRPSKGKSNREQRDDVVDTEQDLPRKGKSKRDDVMDTEQERPRKGKSNREHRDDTVDTEQEGPHKGKSNREQHEDVVDTEQDRPSKGKSNREQRADVMDTEQDRPRKGKSYREQRDNVVDTEQDRPRKGKSNREQRNDVMDTEQDRPRKGKSKSKPLKNTAKNNEHPRQSDVMMEKYLKNVSNEIRYQIESEGPRRSHRNRRLAAEVLRNNPNTLQTDAPKYVMPTIEDVLKYYEVSAKPNAMSHKAKSKSKTSSNTVANQEAQRFERPKENVPPTTVPQENENKKQSRGRPRKNAKKQPETFDVDGFRVPPMPIDHAIPSSNAERSEMGDSSSRSFPQGISVDSGLASAVMMSDDATGAAPAAKKRSKISSKKQSAATQTQPSCSSNAATSTQPAPSDILAEKRKTLDWMMLLMEKQQYRPPALPMVELQGFTHLSVEHLVFDEKDGIEYSFYVYSNGDNFGFLRFPPNMEKRSTRTKRCSLKFLILSGRTDFIINEVQVTAIGGDFLMIPTNSTYQIVNGPQTALMFMIKTSTDPPLRETTGGGK